MKIAIVACEVVKNELEHITKDDPDIVIRKYLEFALHTDPPRMRRTIVDEVNSLEGRVDSVILGYAVCSSLRGIEDDLLVPTAMLPGEDCIDALIGPDRYRAEKDICTGTWFSSPGWAEQGADGLIRNLHLDCMPGRDPRDFLKYMFASYERTLFIDPGIGDTERFLEMTERFSNPLGLRVDRSACTLERFRETVEKAKELGSSRPVQID